MGPQLNNGQKRKLAIKFFEIKRKGRKKGIEMYKKRKRRKEKETL